MFSLTYLAGHTTQDVIAMAAALKEAYPDEKTRPDYVKVLIEKAKKETAKDVARAFFFRPTPSWLPPGRSTCLRACCSWD